MSDDILPMDQVQADAPAESQEQKDQRERDEHGRFAPKQPQPEGEGPRGKPDQDVAIRRYAQERDEARKAADEAKAAHAALQKRLDDMSAIASGKDPNAAPENDNPIAPVLERIEAIDKRLQTADEQRQAEAFEQQVRQFADMDEQRFRQQQPDFPNAVQHYIQSRINELQAFGIEGAQAEQILVGEAQQLLRESALNNRSPAESLYRMAQARGYNGSNVVPIPQPQNRQAGTPGGRSFGNGAGAAPGAVTAQQLAAMSEDDYNAFRQTPEGRAAIKRAMGG